MTMTTSTTMKSNKHQHTGDVGATFTSRMQIAFCTACVLLYISSSNVSPVRSFQLSMVASRFPTSPQTTVRSSSASTSPSMPAAGGITSNLISNLACMALKRRLKTHTHVSCDLSTSNAALMGRVGPVTVRGRGWGSSLGLTCRAIEATVDTCQLDVPRVLTQQKLVLSRPAEGRAMVALTAEDFGNFVTHPLMKPPCPPTIGDDAVAAANLNLTFLKEGVVVDPNEGTVSFYGMCDKKKWKFSLQKGTDARNKAIIQAAPADEDEQQQGPSLERTEALSKALSETSTKFFSEMVFELDGTFLSFEDMALTAKGSEPSVLLKLSILVRKFPSPGLEF